LTKAKHIHKRKPILSSERMLHKDYDPKGSVAKRKRKKKFWEELMAYFP
jgi:hypothetical protein